MFWASYAIICFAFAIVLFYVACLCKLIYNDDHGSKLSTVAFALFAIAGLISSVHAMPSPEEIYRENLSDVEDRCLTQALYFEAASEPEESQRAVAEVVLNRRDSHRYGDFVCDVVAQSRQFSWFHGWPMKPGNMEVWWRLYPIAHDELMKRPLGGSPERQIIPATYEHFCSGSGCLKGCSGRVIGAQCYYN